jgi:GDP-L-fucose synthase
MENNKSAKIFVAGHRGLAGSAIVRRLIAGGYSNIITRTHKELDLTCASSVDFFFEHERPEFVYLSAARVGGILANITSPVEFLIDNLLIEINVCQCSYKYGVKKLLFFGSSCIYPRVCPQPMKEESLLTGPLEKSNKSYALAKIVGLNLCEAYNSQYKTNFISVMPCNLYGPGDTFDLEKAHVVPAFIRKFHEAKLTNQEEITIWGTGNVTREFLHADDLADASVFLMENYNESQFVNVGTSEEITIANLANLMKKISGFEGNIVYDASKPDGAPRKVVDVSRLHSLGWKHKINFEEGIKETYDWFCKSHSDP